MRCPNCKTLWPVDSQNAIATELLGRCLECIKGDLSRSDLDKVIDEQKLRQVKNLGGQNGRSN